MDIATVNRRIAKSGASLMDLPEYIITTFFPQASPLLSRYPALFRVLGVLLAFYYFGPVARLQALWSQTSSLLVSTITVGSEEDLFQYLVAFVSEKRAIRPNQSLNAITNPFQEPRRHRHDPEYEESARRPRNQEKKIQYEQGQGVQIFIHEKRLFWVQRSYGDGHSYSGNRYRKTEILKISCLGRSVRPIKDMIETVYQLNKDKEKSLTIIRRPYSSGYGSRLSWSRLTAKRRRMLDTVILQESQTAAILADVEEYMSESTKIFYADHGIPYRRGYLFHGPPGCGKTSFCLALASKFNLDVYVLTLLDRDLNDTDLMSLLNQLPTPCLLLLEDIDEAGLSRKKTFSSGSKPRRSKSRRGQGVVEPPSNTNDELNSDDDETQPKTQVTLSGLLNAIDGVAAPEGHILIMTTNKPHELDDALVRAGRISVRIAFDNADRTQAAQIFERMYADLPKYLPVTAGVSSDKPTIDLAHLATQFSQGLPDHDFSPADLQDYLLIHKKDPEGAVAGLSSWIETQHEERKRKEEDKEAEIRWKAERAEERRRRWREDLKVAFQEGGEDGLKEKLEEKQKEKKEDKDLDGKGDD